MRKINSNFGVNLTPREVAQRIKHERHFIRSIYRKLESETVLLLDNLNNINVPNIRKKFKLLVLRYIKVLVNFYLDLEERTASKYSIEFVHRVRYKRARSNATLDATINIIMTNDAIANAFGNSFYNNFGIVEEIYQDPDVTGSIIITSKSMDISDVINFYIPKMKDIIEDITYEDGMSGMAILIYKLVRKIMSISGMDEQLIDRLLRN